MRSRHILVSAAVIITAHFALSCLVWLLLQSMGLTWIAPHVALAGSTLFLLVSFVLAFMFASVFNAIVQKPEVNIRITKEQQEHHDTINNINNG